MWRSYVARLRVGLVTEPRPVLIGIRLGVRIRVKQEKVGGRIRDTVMVMGSVKVQSQLRLRLTRLLPSYGQVRITVMVMV